MKVVVQPNGTMELEHRGHTVLTDIKPEEGGQDRALEPIDLMVGSLGACTAAVLSGYFKRHQKDASGLRLDLDWVVEGAPGHHRVSRVEVTVRVPFALDDRMRATVNRLSSACTVHNTLNSEIVVKIVEP